MGGRGHRRHDVLPDQSRIRVDRPLPLLTGGRITGVDERIRIQVRQPSSAAPLGTSCCTAAGGNGRHWKESVSFSGADDPVLTVVASTGGHIADVERFTVTAVRTG